MAKGKDATEEPAAGRAHSAKGRAKLPGREARRRAAKGRGGTPGAEVPIIGVGTSAGGLEALTELLGAVPSDSGMAFLVVQHLDPTHDSQMASVLASRTALRVLQAEEGMPVEPGTVYTIPSGQYLGLRAGRLTLVAQAPEQAPRMSVDFLFRSLADELQEKAICVVLSGSGTDGTLGVRAARGAGGLAVAQDPETAEFDSMPRSAIGTGLVDFVLPPAAIAPTLLDYVRHAYARGAAEGDELAALPAEGLDRILQLLLRANADFRGYKPGTLLRRVHRRMSVNQIGTLAEYTQFLRSQPDEGPKLAKDILISVTSFFRDPAAYEELRELAIVPLVKALPEDQPVRVWVAGCATGEEAYSIAMLVREELEAARKTNPLQLFASDLDEEALALARAGIYPESIAADVSPERLARFFGQHEHTYRVNPDIREAIVFSSHNLVADPPFMGMDLVSCRNVLIYLGAGLQQKLTSLLSFAVRTEGYLFLGPAEGLTGSVETFEPVSKKRRIFRRTPVARHEMVDFPLVPKTPAPTVGSLPSGAKVPPVNGAALAQRALVEHFAAALVLIDSKGSVLYFQGDTDKYLRHPTGGSDLSLFTMARGQLPRRLRAAVHRALESGEPVRVEHAPLRAEGNTLVDVTVKPVGDALAEERLLVVVFEDVQEAASVQGAAPAVWDTGEGAAVLEQLESELRMTREQLRLTTTEHVTASEELRAAHEEAISLNEELRSINEELESSTEELQSVNEELTTLLQERNRALNEVNSDLANLFEATEVATLFLDRELRVRRFTPSATQVLNLIPADVGRPVSHVSLRFRNGELASKAEQVLRDLVPVQTEVQTPERRWYLMRVLPYRSVDGQVEGVVITFADVTALKQAERASQWARVYAERIVATAREPLLVLEADLRVMSANPAFYRVFRLSPEQVEGTPLPELGGGRWSVPALVEKLLAVLPTGEGFEDFEIEHEFPGVGRRMMVLSAARIEAEEEHPRLVLLAMEDITEERRRRQLAEILTTQVSHRTKSNLAIVAGLLELQAQREPPGSASARALRAAVTRIQSFTALQEQVQSTQEEEIEVVEALGRVADMARRALTTGEAEISVEGAPLRYRFEVVANLAILANELITNALKYGGPDETGTLRVRVTVGTEDGTLRLSVWNSGEPVAEGFDSSVAGTTGLFLVSSLAAGQYGGEFQMQPHQGGTLAQVVLPEQQLLRAP